MTTSTMEKIKVMLAFDEGKKIELRASKHNLEWIPFTGSLPAWNWCEYEYRIAPQPPRKFVRWFIETSDGFLDGPYTEEAHAKLAQHLYVVSNKVVAFEMTEIPQNAS